MRGARSGLGIQASIWGVNLDCQCLMGLCQNAEGPSAQPGMWNSSGNLKTKTPWRFQRNQNVVPLQGLKFRQSLSYFGHKEKISIFINLFLDHVKYTLNTYVKTVIVNISTITYFSCIAYVNVTFSLNQQLLGCVCVYYQFLSSFPLLIF